MTALRGITRALLRPAASPERRGVPRQLLLQPRLFDVTSRLLQLRDSSRLRRLRAARPSGGHAAKAFDYNVGVTEAAVTTTRRAEQLYRVLTLPVRDLRREHLLIIGPRNVHELYIAWLYGYSWSNILAIDLYSTNPKILRMNMEAIGFAGASFDAVTMSNTLSYAEDATRAIAEVHRVLLPGGHFVFGSTYAPERTEWPGDRVSGQSVRESLRELGFEFFYYDATDKVNRQGATQTAHLFGVRKPDPAQRGFDRVSW